MITKLILCIHTHREVEMASQIYGLPMQRCVKLTGTHPSIGDLTDPNGMSAPQR